jgi:hypothetical protein
MRAQEWPSGGTLAEAIVHGALHRQSGGVNTSAAFTAMIHAASGLCAVHATGRAHGAVTPSHFFLQATGKGGKQIDERHSSSGLDDGEERRSKTAVAGLEDESYVVKLGWTGSGAWPRKDIALSGTKQGTPCCSTCLASTAGSTLLAHLCSPDSLGINSSHYCCHLHVIS